MAVFLAIGTQTDYCQTETGAVVDDDVGDNALETDTDLRDSGHADKDDVDHRGLEQTNNMREQGGMKWLRLQHLIQSGFLARRDECPESYCRTPGVGISIRMHKNFNLAYNS